MSINKNQWDLAYKKLNVWNIKQGKKKNVKNKIKENIIKTN